MIEYYDSLGIKNYLCLKVSVLCCVGGRGMMLAYTETADVVCKGGVLHVEKSKEALVP